MRPGAPASRNQVDNTVQYVPLVIVYMSGADDDAGMSPPLQIAEEVL